MTVRLASVAENAFNAVERMAEYSKIKGEAAAVIPKSAPEDWPSAGKVKLLVAISKFAEYCKSRAKQLVSIPQVLLRIALEECS